MNTKPGTRTSKVYGSVEEALFDVLRDGMTIMAGGFGLCGIAEQYMRGEVKVELNPQGTLAERIRAGGAGIAGFYTPTGVGTAVAEGKEVREIDGKKYLFEKPLRADLAIVRASAADVYGNLRFYRTARNFNPLMAMAADVTVAEVDKLHERGAIDPDDVHLPGLFVKRVVEVRSHKDIIEHRTTRTLVGRS